MGLNEYHVDIFITILTYVNQLLVLQYVFTNIRCILYIVYLCIVLLYTNLYCNVLYIIKIYKELLYNSYYNNIIITNYGFD